MPSKPVRRKSSECEDGISGAGKRAKEDHITTHYKAVRSPEKPCKAPSTTQPECVAPATASSIVRPNTSLEHAAQEEPSFDSTEYEAQPSARPNTPLEHAAQEEPSFDFSQLRVAILELGAAEVTGDHGSPELTS